MMAAGRESPFTWGIPAILGPKFYPETYMPVTFKEQPVIALMNRIMQLYCDATRNDWVMADQKVQVLHRLRQQTDLGVLLKERISLKVLDHILFSTISHMHTLRGDAASAGIAANHILNLSLPHLPGESDLRKMLEATLLGCRAMAYYYVHECSEAVSYAKEATEKDPKCPLWHFVKYQILRRQRRMSGFSKEPTDEEKKAIRACVTLSQDDPFYMVYLAEMVKANAGNDDAAQIYRFINGCSKADLLIRIASGLLDCGKKKHVLEKAEECLNKVRELDPTNPMFLHQLGVLKQKKGAYGKAAEKFTAAAQANVLMSDVKFVECQLKGKRYKFALTHLQGLLQKYLNKKDQQMIKLLIGLHQLESDKCAEAVEYFLEAILIDPNDSQLKDFPRLLCLKQKSPDIVNMLDYLRGVTYQYFYRGLVNVDVANSMEALRWLCRPKLF